MTRDIVIMGMITGLVANLAKEAITWLLYVLGLIQFSFVHIAAGHFVPAGEVGNLAILATGFVTDWFMAGLFGIVFLLVLRHTGYDYALIKGSLFGLWMYIFVYGAIMALSITSAEHITALANFMMLWPHLAYGITAGWFAKRYMQLV